jgi:hypothetical protein
MGRKENENKISNKNCTKSISWIVLPKKGGINFGSIQAV